MLLWAFGRRDRYRVSGESMRPTLEPGDYVLADPRAEASVGDVVVARHPWRSDAILIKRVAAIEDGALDLRGDAPHASTDSRTIGRVPVARLLGRVTTRIH